MKKNIINIIAIGILATLFSCRQAENQHGKIPTKSDNVQKGKTEKQITKEEMQKQIEEQNKIDSLRLNSALEDALSIAQTAFKADSFTKKYEFNDHQGEVINIEIVIGRLFNDYKKYFLLRRSTSGTTYLNLYNISHNKKEKLIEREQGGMTYICDTIFDANGDGYKDFIVRWYPAAGCCLRNVYNVYLNQPNKENFTKDYEFINPTFSAKEKIIRGVEYGHPGEVGLYKYKWNRLQVDTIEFIYPNASVKGQFIKTKKGAYKPTEKEGVVLKAVPREYHNIESYEWFTDF